MPRPLPHLEADLIRLAYRLENTLDGMSPQRDGAEAILQKRRDVDLIEEARLAIRQATKASPPLPTLAERLRQYLNLWAGLCVAGGFAIATLTAASGFSHVAALLTVLPALVIIATVLAFTDGVRK